MHSTESSQAPEQDALKQINRLIEQAQKLAEARNLKFLSYLLGLARIEADKRSSKLSC